ncbi:hypothetical protein FRC12_006118 [Ceratobasidium sp. 428]|nr:hypothetical protein FRC12_006118 [Ceratobasidium sp. 428]
MSSGRIICALTLPEVFDLICSFLDTTVSRGHFFKSRVAYPNERRGDLVALLRTCRSLFYLAARRLWGSLLNARHLLQLLPGVCVVEFLSSWAGSSGLEDDINLEDLNIVKADLPAYLSPDYFNRFDLYAQYVKHLIILDTFWLTAAETGAADSLQSRQTLLSYACSHTLLPNLSSLEIWTDCTLAGENAAGFHGCMSWPKMFLSPLTTSVIVSCPKLPSHTQEETHEIVLAAIQQCSGLEHLELPLLAPNSPTNTPSSCLNFNKQTHILVNLRHLQCSRIVLTLEFVEWLAELPNLTHLALDRLSMGDDALLLVATPPHNIWSLKKLKIGSVTLEAATTLCNTLVAYNLAKLSIGFDRLVSVQPSSLFGQLFTSIAKSYPNLAELYLSPLVDDMQIMVGCFEPLKTLPIRSLGMISMLGRDLTLANASRAIKNWTRLDKLSIGLTGYPVEELSDILPFHPNLGVFHINLREGTWGDLSFKPGQPNNLIYRPLSLISNFRFCEDYPEDKLDKLARYLTSLRPGIRCVSRSDWLRESSLKLVQQLTTLNSALASYSSGTIPSKTATISHPT